MPLISKKKKLNNVCIAGEKLTIQWIIWNKIISRIIHIKLEKK